MLFKLLFMLNGYDVEFKKGMYRIIVVIYVVVMIFFVLFVFLVDFVESG